MFYRKYRPQTIANFDNQKIKETLGKALLSNNFSHAYLFIGPRGTGKTSMARILAKTVNCKNRKRGEEPCNKCDSCKAITTGNCLDVMEIDAASNTGVDDIRSLREKVGLAPTSCLYKVYIIDEVHMLSTSAFNAILKTLEEPPAHVIFVLATTDFQKIPETVSSRCLVYDFGKVTEAEIVGSLARVVAGEKLTVAKDVLAVVAAQSSGSFRDAQKLLEQLSQQSAKLTLARLGGLNTHKIDEVSRELLELVASRKKTGALKLVEENSDKIKDLINSLISQLRNVLLFRNGIEVEIKDLEISLDEINKLILALVEAASLMRDCPIPQLPLEMMIVEFCTERGKTAFKEKLAEGKNRDILKKAISDIMGKETKVIF